MRKLKIASCLVAVLSIVIFAGCLKNENTDAGPTGPTGKTGIAGGSLSGGYSIQPQLSAQNVSNGTSPVYYASFPFPTYKDTSTYLINVFINRLNTKEWYKLPQYNVYSAGDEIYSTYGNGTIDVVYFSSNNAWPADSVMNADIVIIPQQR
jgi:hypothetical protein